MAEWEKIDAYLRGIGVRIDAPNPAQTTGGMHVVTSEHYQGRARDYGIYDSDAYAVCRALVQFAQGPKHVVDELFFTPLGVFYKNGGVVDIGPAERKIHLNHCHVGIRQGANFPAAPIPAPKPATPEEAMRKYPNIKYSCLLSDTPNADGRFQFASCDEKGQMYVFNAPQGINNLDTLDIHVDNIVGIVRRPDRWGVILLADDGATFALPA